ncbi:ewing's tumor-associated antigen 1 [Kryptolebias marmoratus]|uniref:ETAA1 activator of ATR kinase n=1 Tax=Kryptolebias marmoratus TaxID=37003 RepID=A0A3Q3ATK3_KRYMA|nr:ewing's tumor-associated antigen 1 [Kryptolebias marmoratus]
MSDSARSPEFSELWRNHISKPDRNKTQQGRKTGQQMPETGASPVCSDLLSPRFRGSSRYHGLNVGESPGDVEVSQDIFWDSTSPTQTGFGHKNTQVVEISDIVNRIAPKNIKPKGSESSLFRWINDGTIPCTPENPKPKVRKRSSRQSKVEDLMKLARQFDENMQQGEETSEQLNSVNDDLRKTKPSVVKNLKCPSSSAQAEAELHALFDCSTQRVSGRLSEGSGCSQEVPDQIASVGFAKRQQAELKQADKSGTSEQKETRSHGTKNCEFYDDWDNDDLLNDSFILAITQNPNGRDANPETTPQARTQTSTKPPSVLNSDSAQKPTEGRCKMSCSALQDLCPKLKTTNRSTFRLESNSHFLSKVNKEVSKSNFTVIEPKSKINVKNSAAPKLLPTSQPNKVTHIQAEAPSVQDISDSLWDDGDDELLYQVCDSVERTSNGQPKEVNPNNSREKEEKTADRRLKTTESVHSGVSASNRQSSGAFVRSNSLPGTGCKTNYQGWNVLMQGANRKPGMSQSFPGSHVSLGTFNQDRDFSGTFRARSSNVDTKLQTVAARVPQNSKSHPAAFKRNMSDSAIISNKVFVTSQTAGKCSAAEIERKKQEALARRRLRMQNAPKQ